MTGLFCNPLLTISQLIFRAFYTPELSVKKLTAISVFSLQEQFFQLLTNPLISAIFVTSTFARTLTCNIKNKKVWRSIRSPWIDGCIVYREQLFIGKLVELSSWRKTFLWKSRKDFSGNSTSEFSVSERDLFFCCSNVFHCFLGARVVHVLLRSNDIFSRCFLHGVPAISLHHLCLFGPFPLLARIRELLYWFEKRKEKE